MSEHQWRYSDSSQYDSVCERCGCTDTSTSANLPCTINAPAIRLVRPMQTEYMVVGKILDQWKEYLYMTDEQQFLHMCMKHSNGSMNPARIRAIYKQLMEEAGFYETPSDT